MLGRKKINGWPVRLVANAGWLVYSAAVFAWPLLVNHIVFSFSNARGWWQWKKSLPCKTCNGDTVIPPGRSCPDCED